MVDEDSPLSLESINSERLSRVDQRQTHGGPGTNGRDRLCSRQSATAVLIGSLLLMVAALQPAPQSACDLAGFVQHQDTGRHEHGQPPIREGQVGGLEDCLCRRPVHDQHL